MQTQTVYKQEQLTKATSAIAEVKDFVGTRAQDGLTPDDKKTASHMLADASRFIDSVADTLSPYGPNMKGYQPPSHVKILLDATFHWMGEINGKRVEILDVYQESQSIGLSEGERAIVKWNLAKIKGLINMLTNEITKFETEVERN